MRKIAYVTAVLGALVAMGAGASANAAVYCFDGAGRSLGSGFDPQTPHYGQIEHARRTGGYCRDIGHGNSIPQLESGGHYYDHPPKYYRHTPKYRSHQNYGDSPRYHGRDRNTPQERQIRKLQRINPQQKYERHPDPTHPPIPQQPINTAR